MIKLNIRNMIVITYVYKPAYDSWALFNASYSLNAAFNSTF